MASLNFCSNKQLNAGTFLSSSGPSQIWKTATGFSLSLRSYKSLMLLLVTPIARSTSPSKASQNHCSTLPAFWTDQKLRHPPHTLAPIFNFISLQSKPHGTKTAWAENVHFAAENSVQKGPVDSQTCPQIPKLWHLLLVFWNLVSACSGDQNCTQHSHASPFHQYFLVKRTTVQMKWCCHKSLSSWCEVTSITLIPWLKSLVDNLPTKVNLPGRTSSKDLFTWTES